MKYHKVNKIHAGLGCFCILCLVDVVRLGIDKICQQDLGKMRQHSGFLFGRFEEASFIFINLKLKLWKKQLGQHSCLTKIHCMALGKLAFLLDFSDHFFLCRKIIKFFDSSSSHPGTGWAKYSTTLESSGILWTERCAMVFVVFFPHTPCDQ